MLKQLDRPAVSVGPVEYDQVRTPKADIADVNGLSLAEVDEPCAYLLGLIETLFEFRD